MTALLLLFLAGAAGGALNSVAGGGSFIVFPSLLFSGIAPVAANATTTVGLWPAGVAGAAAYRRELPRDKSLGWLALASAAGGGIGAKLLLGTSDATFATLIPWLLLAASVVFTFGPRFTARHGSARLPLAVGVGVQLLISSYGGYFGGGMGILMLATYTLMGMVDIHAMNALKVLLGVLINGVAVVAFLVAGKVEIATAAPVAVGSVAGGFFGAAVARRVDPKHVRKLVLVLAWAMTAFFFYRTYR